MENLDQLLRNLAFKFTNLNSGGCGVISYLLFNKFKDNFKQNTIKILSFYPEKKTVDYDLYVRLNSSSNSTPRSLIKLSQESDLTYHLACCIKVKNSWYVLDPYYSVVTLKKYCKFNNFSYFSEPVNPDLLKKLASVQSPWNRMFDRGQIKFIKSYIKSF